MLELGSAEQAAEAAEERMKIALALAQPIPDTLRAVTERLRGRDEVLFSVRSVTIPTPRSMSAPELNCATTSRDLVITQSYSRKCLPPTQSVVLVLLLQVAPVSSVRALTLGFLAAVSDARCERKPESLRRAAEATQALAEPAPRPRPTAQAAVGKRERSVEDTTEGIS